MGEQSSSGQNVDKYQTFISAEYACKNKQNKLTAKQFKANAMEEQAEATEELLHGTVRTPISIKWASILLELTEAGYIIGQNWGGKLGRKSQFSPHYNYSRSDYL